MDKKIDIVTYKNIVFKFKKNFKNYIEYNQRTLKKSNSALNEEIKNMLMEAAGNSIDDNGNIVIPENALLEAPNDYLAEIKKQYAYDSKDNDQDSLFNGLTDSKSKEFIIGTGNNKIQKKGITCLALSVISFNRWAKLIEFEQEKKRIKGKLSSEEEYNNKKDIRDFYTAKHSAISELITCLFLYNEKEKEFYSYGFGFDDEKQLPTFIMDLPGITQFSVHFGSEFYEKQIIKNAYESAKSIIEYQREKITDNIDVLESKCKELEQQNTEEIKLKMATLKENLKKYDEIYNNLIKDKNNILNITDNNMLFQKYENSFYEYKCGLPIKYTSSKINDIINNSGIKEAKDTESFKNAIKDICNVDISGRKINERELHYVGVKLNFSKKKLQLLHKIHNKVQIYNKSLNDKDEQHITTSDLVEYSRECVDNSNYEERNTAKKAEENLFKDDKER